MRLSDHHAQLFEGCHKGHLFAYAASYYCGDLWRLSIVRDGEIGHYPISEDWWIGTHAEADAEAARLNWERLRIPQQHQTSIIAQSMRSR